MSEKDRKVEHPLGTSTTGMVRVSEHSKLHAEMDKQKS